MRLRASLIFGFGLLFLLAETRVWAQETQPSERQLKAAFLFNFARFTEWPATAFATSNAPMVLGVLGKNPFGDDLERTLKGKTLNNHPLVIKEFHSPVEATNCQVLFISPSEKGRLLEILNSVRGFSVLTVSETEHFTETGGMINFVKEDNKIHFQINNDEAVKAGLKISSRLLSLAVATGK